MLRSNLMTVVLGVAVVAAAACAGSAQTPAVKTVTVTDASFGCIRDLKPVRGYFVGNLLGDVDATVKVASAGTGVYPVGSVVQLVPGEAMVKHAAGYNAATKDWEFFELNVAASGTKIGKRGAAEVVNQFGGNCLSCHAKAEARYDMICEQGHGCDPIPVTPVLAKAIQNTDPRCPKVDNLPADQQAALQQLAAFRAAAAARAAAPAAPATPATAQ